MTVDIYSRSQWSFSVRWSRNAETRENQRQAILQTLTNVTPTIMSAPVSILRKSPRERQWSVGESSISELSFSALSLSEHSSSSLCRVSFRADTKPPNVIHRPVRSLDDLESEFDLIMGYQESGNVKAKAKTSRVPKSRQMSTRFEDFERWSSYF